jgi:hypothetical protein
MRVVWATPDPGGLARHLGDTLAVGIDMLAGEAAILFPNGAIILADDGHVEAPHGGGGGRLRLDLESLDDVADPTRPMHPGGLADLVGVGWATVELDRAVPEFAPVQFGAAMPDGSLGARARVGRVGAGSLVLLEPSTEGRLAAALARFGEGVTAIYVAAAAGGFEQLAARLRGPGSGPGSLRVRSVGRSSPGLRPGVRPSVRRSRRATRPHLV